jgi:hypothetical protein
VKVALAWDYALCQWVSDSPESSVPGVVGCTATDNIGKTDCYVDWIVDQAKTAYSAAPLCVELDITIYPDSGCTKDESYYKDLDVVSTSGNNALYDTFIDAAPFNDTLMPSAIKHILAGSDVGTNIGYAYTKTLCNPNRGGATWVS